MGPLLVLKVTGGTNAALPGVSEILTTERPRPDSESISHSLVRIVVDIITIKTTFSECSGNTRGSERVFYVPVRGK